MRILLEGRFMLESAMPCPFQSEIHADGGMYPSEKSLANLVVEDVPKKTECPVGVTQSITVCQIKQLVGQFQRHRLTMQDDTTLLLQIIGAPNVMIASEEMHLHPIIRQLAHLPQKTCVSPGNHCGIFKPEVKHVAQHVYSLCLVLDVIQEAHETAFLLPPMLQSTATQMGITDKINIPHRQRFATSVPVPDEPLRSSYPCSTLVQTPG